MAYTITQPAYTLYPTDNLSWSTAYSTDYTQPAFVYKFSVQVGSTTGTLATASVNRVPVTPGSTAASFAPNAILRNYVTTPVVFDNTTGPSGSNDGLKYGRVIYGQEYNSNGTVVGSTGATGTTFLFWNSIFGYAEWPSYNANQWIIGPTSVGVNFLTDGPATRCIIPQDLLYVNIEDSAATVRTRADLFPAGTWEWGVYQPYPEFFNIEDSTPSPSANISGLQIFDDECIEMTTWPQPGVTGNTDVYARAMTVAAGDTITIRIENATAYGVSSTNYPRLQLVGRNGATGAWTAIGFLNVTIEISPSAQYASLTVVSPANFTQLGLRFAVTATNQLGSPSICGPVTTWTISSPNNFFWSITQGGVETRYEAIKGKQNWLNVGSEVRGGTGFTVQIEDTTGNILSDIITYDADCDDCTACEHRSLTWLNSKGGYDTFQFYCVNNKTIELQRYNGQQTLAQSYSVGDRGLYNTANIGKLRTRVNTNYVMPETVDWLESLMMSPSVYEVSSTGELNPVIVDTTTYQRYAKPNRLMVVEFEYTEANLRTSQIR
jgi:hypothetical protein